MKKDDESGPVRSRTTTGRQRSMELLMNIVGDKDWGRPNLVVDRTESPARDAVCVLASDGAPGVRVAYWQDGELWVIVLPDEFAPKQVGEHSLLGQAEPRWVERTLHAVRRQREIEAAASELERYRSADTR